MNTNTTAYKASVMQARLQGADIEVRPRSSLEWRLTTVEPSWNWVKLDYRVAEHRTPIEGFAVIERGALPFSSRYASGRAMLVFATASEAADHAHLTRMDDYDIIQLREWVDPDPIEEQP